MYKLTYIEGLRGRAEVIKLLFHVAGEKLQVVNVPAAEWPSIKPATPLGQVPILTTEQGTITQTTAILMFCAQRLGFLPETEWDRAVTDSIVITMNEMNSCVGMNLYLCTIFHVKELSDTEQTEVKTKCRETITKSLNYVESMSKTDSKFIFGDKMTVADLALYATLEYCCYAFPEFREHSDWLVRWLSEMEKDDRMKSYHKTREPSQYGI